MSQTPLKLEGKVAVITGAGSGIGAATAKLFTQLGARVAITGTTKSKLEATAKECELVSIGQPKPLIIVGNITDNYVQKKIIDDTVQTFGRLDILVNNAGAARIGKMLDEGSLVQFDEIMDVNLRSVIALTKLAAPHLIKTKGSIVNNASVAGKAARFASAHPFYGISKAGLIHLTQHAARELGPHQVRVNSVSPGVIKTNIFASIGMNADQESQYVVARGPMHALGRVGESCEVAQAIAFLASEDASFITGTDIVVDGGLMVNVVPPPAPKK